MIVTSSHFRNNLGIFLLVAKYVPVKSPCVFLCSLVKRRFMGITRFLPWVLPGLKPKKTTFLGFKPGNTPGKNLVIPMNLRLTREHRKTQGDFTDLS